MFEVKLQGAEDLTEKELADMPNNGCGREYATYLRVVYNGDTILLKSDASEPEDADFSMDFSWIKDAIMMAYGIGCKQ